MSEVLICSDPKTQGTSMPSHWILEHVHLIPGNPLRHFNDGGGGGGVVGGRRGGGQSGKTIPSFPE